MSTCWSLWCEVLTSSEWRLERSLACSCSRSNALSSSSVRARSGGLGSFMDFLTSLSASTAPIGLCRHSAGLPPSLKLRRSGGSARGLEVQRHAVDAVAKTGRRRPVLEDVPQVPAAAAAMHFGTGHPVAAVHGGAGRPLERGEEAGPAGPALELAAGRKQRLAAAGTAERAGVFLLQERTRTRRLGAVPAQHRVLLRRQRSAPFLVSFFDRIFHRRLIEFFQPRRARRARLHPRHMQPSCSSCRRGSRLRTWGGFRGADPPAFLGEIEHEDL